MRKVIVIVAAASVLVAVAAVLHLVYFGRTAPPKPPSSPIAPAPKPVERTVPAAPEPSADLSPPETAPPMAEITGTVTDAETGGPIAGATVTLSAPQGPPPSPEAETVEVSTDDSGAFMLSVPQSAWTSATCTCEGYVREQQPLIWQTGRQLELVFRLHRGAEVSGRVSDRDSGAPLSRVRVEAAGARESYVDIVRARRQGRAPSATTNTEGRYAIKGLQAGAYRIQVRARSQGYLFGADDAVSLTLDGPIRREGVDFALVRGAVVEGTVSDPDGQPIVKADVRAVPGKMFQDLLKATDGLGMDVFTDLRSVTDGAGRFRIAGLDYDRAFRIRARAEGFAEGVGEAFAIAVGEPPRSQEIVLTSGSRVAGVAQYEDGSPASRRQVRLFPNLGAVFSGQFTSPASTLTDETGGFLFEHVAAGEYTLQSGDQSPFTAFEQDKAGLAVNLDGTADVEGLVLVLEPPSRERASLEGEVLDSTGQPVADASVKAVGSEQPGDRASAVTDENGRFCLTGLSGSHYNLSVSCERGQVEQRRVPVDRRATLRLNPPSRVAGVVLDQAGAPVAACPVSLERLDVGTTQAVQGIVSLLMGARGRARTTDSEGVFEFTSVLPGRYIVEAKSETKGLGQSSPFTVVSGGTISHLRIRLQPGCTFSGIVEDADAYPVQGAVVRLLTTMEADGVGLVTSMLPAMLRQPGGSATTDASGLFEITEIAAASYDLDVSHPSYARYAESGLNFGATGSVTGRRIVLGKGGSASGQYMADGEPKEGMLVHVMGPSGMQIATTDEQGRIELERLTEGDYIINVIDPALLTSGQSFSFAPEVVHITEGGEVHIGLGANEGVKVSGEIKGEDLGILTTITLRRSGGPNPEDLQALDIPSLVEVVQHIEAQGLADRNGRFSLDDIEPGSYVLDVYTLDVDLDHLDLQWLLNVVQSPRIRKEIEVGTESIELSLTVPPR